MKRLIIVMALFCVFGSTAEARHHKSYCHVMVSGAWGKCFKTAAHKRSHYRHRYSHLARLTHQHFSNGRPRAWCGWYARLHLAPNDPGVAFNLARNWARWGRSASPGVGVMVVWSHHVGMITGRTSDGQWIVKSGNDGHSVRERPRSLAGAIAFRSV